jgi:hypothetical protein
MADWKQITARIRRARTSKDPAGQLAALYEKTHDAMVAFELAKYFETSGKNADAAKWYGVSAERFRRADWKVKAQEAAVRLGGEGGAGTTAPVDGETESDEPSAALAPVLVMPEPGLPSEQSAAVFAAIVDSGSGAADTGEDESGESAEAASEIKDGAAGAGAGPESEDKRRRRRGRRGGRNRRKPGAGPVGVDSSASPAKPASIPTGSSRRAAAPPPTAEAPDIDAPVSIRRSMPPLPIEPLPEGAAAGPRGRYGDPGLSSRISLLEMQFRRLLSCEAVKLEEANNAPVGPGVFVLTDSDLTSYYYAESCQTLRIAVANLLRGNSSRRGADSITKQLAEHLGIAETRVPKYLAEHCVVRWLQLDEGASLFAHFVIAVLRPILNE